MEKTLEAYEDYLKGMKDLEGILAQGRLLMAKLELTFKLIDWEDHIPSDTVAITINEGIFEIPNNKESISQTGLRRRLTEGSSLRGGGITDGRKKVNIPYGNAILIYKVQQTFSKAIDEILKLASLRHIIISQINK